MNLLLSGLSQAQHDILYFAFHILGCLLAAVFIMLYSRCYQVKPNQTLMLIEVAAMIYLSMFIWQELDKLAYGIPHRDSAKTILLLWPYAAIASRCSMIPVKDALDVLAPAFLVGRSIGIIGCVAYGCCYGPEVAWGLYSAVKDSIVFPVQLLETVLSWGLIIVLIDQAKRKRFRTNGMIFLETLFAFGVMRFFTDWIRIHPKIFGRSSIDGIYAIAMLVEGVAFLLYARVLQPKQAH